MTRRDAMGSLSPSPVGARSAWGGARGLAACVGLAAAVVLAGCENPLDVENPNNLVAEDLENPSAVAATVNGALATLADAVGEVGATYSVTTDELIWIGSRDAWNQMNLGNLDDPTNEFSDDAFSFVGEARFMAARAVATAERFDGEGELDDRSLLVRAYLYGALIYSYIADVYDDFALPTDPLEPAAAVGESNMIQLYDQALDWLGQGLAIARQLGLSERETQILAVRARVHHARSVWQKLNPKGSVPSDPLVNNAEAVADAQAFLGKVGPTADWKMELIYTSATVGSDLSFQVNQRGELQIGPDYVTIDPESPTDITGIIIQDPIDGIVDPVIQAKLAAFLTGNSFAPFTVTSAREMHLILAEAALAQGDEPGFTTHVNHVRAMDGLTPYSGQIPALELLKHERRVNLYLMLRRLSDHYRFGDPDPVWLSTSAAATTPGTFFPISITEIRSNPQIGG